MRISCKPVQAAAADHNETFGAGQGHSQEGLSPEPTQSNKVRLRKGLENSNFGLFDNGKNRCSDNYFCNVWLPGGALMQFVDTRWLPGGR